MSKTYLKGPNQTVKESGLKFLCCELGTKWFWHIPSTSFLNISYDTSEGEIPSLLQSEKYTICGVCRRSGE